MTYAILASSAMTAYVVEFLGVKLIQNPQVVLTLIEAVGLRFSAATRV